MRKSVYHKSELWEAYQRINIRDAISVIDQVSILLVRDVIYNVNII